MILGEELWPAFINNLSADNSLDPICIAKLAYT